MGLFKKSTTQKANFELLLFPGEWDLWLRGVSFHQDGLRKAGIGQHRFFLMPEPTNKVDKRAVSVSVLTKSEPALVGYLPQDEIIKQEMFDVGQTLVTKGWLAAVDGVIEKKGSDFVATLRMPKAAAIKVRLAEWNEHIAPTAKKAR
jgi:hypothetical protein